MGKKSLAKKRFEVLEGEKVSDCMDRIKKEGYSPIRRSEQPVFKEVITNGEKTFVHHGQKIIFDAVKHEH